jgi:hypothetical protein
MSMTHGIAWRVLSSPPARRISTCGYGASAIAGLLMVGSVMGWVLLLRGWRKRDPGILMPMAGSGSLAMSAACHRPADDENAAVLPIKYY